MASRLRHPAPRAYVSIVNGNAKATTRALGNSTRLRLLNIEEWDHAQAAREQEVLEDGNPAGLTRKGFAKDVAPRFIAKKFHLLNKQAKADAMPKTPKARPFTPKKPTAEATPKKPKAEAEPAPPITRWANARVTVPGAAAEHSFSAVFLRDICSCPRCVHQSTRQKLFVTADIPTQIEAVDVQSDAQSVKIRWSNDVPGYDGDHVTEIPLATLSNYVTKGNDLPSHDTTPRVLWDADMYQQRTQDFTYEAYMEDDTILLKALRQLESHGLLFVTDVPADEKSVKRLSKRIGPLKTTFYGKTWDVRSVPQAKNVAYTSQNLGFHMDLMYMKQPPHLQLLHCIRSSSAGGASLFTDSFKAAVDLRKNDIEAFEGLGKIKVDYHYDHKTDYYYQSRSVIELKRLGLKDAVISEYGRQAHISVSFNPRDSSVSPIDVIDAVSWSPPFQAPFRLESGVKDVGTSYGGDYYLSRKVDHWHDAARKFNELIHRPEAIYERLMKPGECVIFDNRRVLHARKAFEVGDMGKERWLRGAYIDKDPFMSKLKILNERYGAAVEEVELKEKQEQDAYFEMQREA
ncbi:Dioxygenase str8 [Fulvia fulva]|uniref:Dioxygenase str8 n=1 Tax=Passalora fulva TaxID=5499 RepID=A0A9Q8P3Y5_PASFU|nr:Dioxygenase str8 [Fulvia fulva]KAK4635625.1 Dioxygenase str8 [Fulvia fulva]KAK4637606.1 Dioxygenase str8 [Fulvia fulva]UJO12418.1 Dioxygenase str8 [Fulvia fulva]WPV09443.1 Dioxygenase str8 [Fulvia fulva]WPV23073.1 Dioxygenase str8 [Fulvia fulva]